MNAVRGRVRGGHVETDTALPEGVEVVVLTQGRDEPFDLQDAEIAELESRMATDDGDLESSDAILEKLRRTR